MKDICVYTTPEVLEHKKIDGWVYWQLRSLPLNIDMLVKIGRIYFAVEGAIIGYFEIECSDDIQSRIEWHSSSWTSIKPVPQRPFQGFKYIERGMV